MSQPLPLPIRMAGVGHEFGANGVRVRALDGIDLEVAPERETILRARTFMYAHRIAPPHARRTAHQITIVIRLMRSSSRCVDLLFCHCSVVGHDRDEIRVD